MGRSGNTSAANWQVLCSSPSLPNDAPIDRSRVRNAGLLLRAAAAAAVDSCRSGATRRDAGIGVIGPPLVTLKVLLPVPLPLASIGLANASVGASPLLMMAIRPFA